MQVWAQSVVAGVPDDLYWASTPAEVAELLDAIAERESRQEREAALRAGLVASEVRNTMRQKDSDRVWQAGDFVKKAPVRLSVEESIMAMRAWAADHNRKYKA